MAIVRLDALCECDACQTRFGVEIGLDNELGTFTDFDAIVREEVRSGQGTYYVWTVRGKATVDRIPLDDNPTVQAGWLLCGKCSKVCDALPVEGDLTRRQVCEALGLPIEGDD